MDGPACGPLNVQYMASKAIYQPTVEKAYQKAMESYREKATTELINAKKQSTGQKGSDVYNVGN